MFLSALHEMGRVARAIPIPSGPRNPGQSESTDAVAEARVTCCSDFEDEAAVSVCWLGLAGSLEVTCSKQPADVGSKNKSHSRNRIRTPREGRGLEAIVPGGLSGTAPSGMCIK